MYQNIYIEKPKQGKPLVHIWDDKKGYQKFQFTPYAYQKSQTGTYRSLYGDKLKKVKEIPEKGPKNVTNALFVGSTTELQKMLKEKK